MGSLFYQSEVGLLCFLLGRILSILHNPLLNQLLIDFGIIGSIPQLFFGKFSGQFSSEHLIMEHLFLVFAIGKSALQTLNSARMVQMGLFIVQVVNMVYYHLICQLLISISESLFPFGMFCENGFIWFRSTWFLRSLFGRSQSLKRIDSLQRRLLSHNINQFTPDYKPK